MTKRYFTWPGIAICLIAAGYAVVSFFFAALTLWSGFLLLSNGLTGSTSERVAEIIMFLALLCLTFIFVRLSIGFWKFQKRAYDAALFVHGMFMVGQVTQYVLRGFRIEPGSIIAMLLNGLIVLFLFFASSTGMLSRLDKVKRRPNT